MKTAVLSCPRRHSPLRPGRRKAPGVPRFQQGVMLLEALMAVVIFSLGILALIGLQSVAIREVTESKARSDASYLADKVLGDLGSFDLAGGSATASTLLTDFAGNYTETTAPAGANNTVYPAWQTLMARTLPGGRLIINIESTADPLNPAESVRAATITVQWTIANGAQRNFSQTARLVG
jgi:type IV pilus assembly protein PilV